LDGPASTERSCISFVARGEIFLFFLLNNWICPIIRAPRCIWNTGILAKSEVFLSSKQAYLIWVFPNLSKIAYFGVHLHTASKDQVKGLAQNLILDILGVPYSIPQAKEACLQGIQYQYKHAMSQLGQPSTTICSSIVLSVANAVFYEACLCPWTATVVACTSSLQ
jgi:hypothetical protein